LNFLTSISLPSKLLAFIFQLSTSFIIASAKGCSEFFSRAYRIFKYFSLSAFNFQLSTFSSTTFGFPSVIVHVLSNTTKFTFANFCKLSAFFTNIQFKADFHTQIVTAIGVASHIAQGQATTKTAIKLTKPTLNSQNKLQIIRLKNAITKTIGTKTDTILSAKLWIGALLF
jgi:hypothetical protein